MALQKPHLCKGLTRLLAEETRDPWFFSLREEASALAKKAANLKKMLDDPSDPLRLVSHHTSAITATLTVCNAAVRVPKRASHARHGDSSQAAARGDQKQNR